MSYIAFATDAFEEVTAFYGRGDVPVTFLEWMDPQSESA